MGGSSSDRVVQPSYEVGQFEIALLDYQEAMTLAKQRCETWSYAGAQAFGGATRQCKQLGGYGGVACGGQ
ncbi:YecR family lipoprotein [Lysobacter sp. GCM10012299]|uniref:YecR family lipoprotein n=1 Tax=Lysobacter sp. GCM10012299 TaxID=3317333 RepID=UPI003609E639